MMDKNSFEIWNLPCFEDELTRVLDARSRKILPPDGKTIAAVLVPLFSVEGRRHVLLTKRSQTVEHHKGEISFPGGKLDPDDADLLSCALRETDEEVGIAPGDVRVIGALDDFYTVATRYVVAPFVGVIPYPYELRPSGREIAGILSVPLEVFFDPIYKSEDIWMFQGQSVPMVSYNWQGHVIWGATARILNHFAELMEQWQVEHAHEESICTDSTT
jgi:8-oxo-dGTP pyrophosphatase MutT (NUDIX family)